MLKNSLGWTARASGFRPVLYVAVISGALCTASLLLIWMSGHDWSAALRDRSLAPPDNPYGGLFSDLGIALMATATLALLVATLRWRTWAHAFFLVFAFLFFVDDAFLLHERLGDWEKLVFVAYGACFALAWLTILKNTATFSVWPLFIIASAFAASVGFDVIGPEIEAGFSALQIPYPAGFHYFLEDVPKFIGIVTFAMFALSEAMLTENDVRTSAAPVE